MTTQMCFNCQRIKKDDTFINYFWPKILSIFRVLYLIAEEEVTELCGPPSLFERVLKFYESPGHWLPVWEGSAYSHFCDDCSLPQPTLQLTLQLAPAHDSRK